MNLSNAIKEATSKGCSVQEAGVAHFLRAQLMAMAKTELEVPAAPQTQQVQQPPPPPLNAAKLAF